MKRFVGRAIFFCLVLGILSSCSIYGIFSTGDPALGLIREQKDLSGEIPAAAAGSFTLSVVEGHGKEYVVLASDLPYDGTHLWLMDANLSVLQTLTYADFSAGGFPLSGSRAWFTAQSWSPDSMIVGNQPFRFTVPDKLSWVGWSIPQGPEQFFFSEFVVGQFNVAQISAASSSLTYTTYNDTLSSTGTVTAVIGAGSAYSLLAVFSDANATDAVHQAAFFVLRDMDAGVDHFLKIPWTDIMGTVAQPLVSSYELFSRPADSIRPEFLGYAADSFFAFRPGSNSDTGDFIRFSPTGAALPGSLHFEKLPDMQVAYSISGTHYFTFDRTTRVLSRRAAWW